MNTSTQSFAERVRQGELLLGTVIGLSAVENTEILAQCGFDWLFIDAEHGAFNPQQAVPILQAAGQCPCLLRVPTHDETWLKKALDIGPAGIIVPQVNDASSAEKIIRQCKYPPKGSRGMGLSRASQYGMQLADYIQHANDSVAVILQAEHKDAAMNIEEIIDVEGIDAILVGPFDLSASVGKPGQINDPEVVELVDRITEACTRRGVTLATAVAGVNTAREYIARGFTLVSAGADSLHLANSARAVLDGMKDK